jgi:hypothetical protein
MPFFVPREGDVRLLADMLGGGALEDWSLGLFNAARTPAETDTAADYTAHEATFAGYARKTLARSVSPSTWNAPALQPPSGSPAWSTRSQVGHAQYGSAPQSWTCAGPSVETIFGYFIVGATSGALICAEAFATPRTLAAGDSLSMTPVFETA